MTKVLSLLDCHCRTRELPEEAMFSRQLAANASRRAALKPKNVLGQIHNIRKFHPLAGQWDSGSMRRDPLTGNLVPIVIEQTVCSF